MYVDYFHRYYGFVFDEPIKTTSTKVFSTLAFINILEKLIYLQTLSCLRERHLGNFLYSDGRLFVSFYVYRWAVLNCRVALILERGRI